MKLIATLTLFALLSSVSATTQSRPKDLLGWEGSRWGMKAADIEKVFGPRAEKLPSFELYGEWYYDHTVEVTLKGQACTAILVMDTSTEKLVGVDVRTDQSESQLLQEEVFKSIESLLLEQYGAPDFRKDERASEKTVLTRTWKFPTTTVELGCAWDKQSHNSDVIIRYRPTEKKSPVANSA